MAALELARRGNSVAVLDWRANIGDKLCTGIIGRECAELAPPAPEHIHGEAQAATIVSPLGRRYRVARGETQAYIVNRPAYINSVAESAMQAGAEYILNSRVTDVRITDRHAKISARADGVTAEYACRIVILASGFGSPLLRMVGLDAKANAEYLVGCQVEAIAPGLSETEVYLGDGTAQNSFAWLVPLSDARALVGMAPRRRVNGQMDDFIARLKSDGRIADITAKPETWGIPIRPLSPSYADRTLVAGDAAGLVKPTTGGGIFYSFISGQLAAETAQKSPSNSDKLTAAKDMRGYERSWRKVFGRELRIGYYARMLFETLSDEQIERLMRRVHVGWRAGRLHRRGGGFRLARQGHTERAATCQYTPRSRDAGAFCRAIRGAVDASAMKNALLKHFSQYRHPHHQRVLRLPIER